MSDLKGNCCLLYLQKLTNLCLLVISFGFIDIGIFLAYSIQSFDAFPLLFIIFGTLQLLLAFLAICQKSSKIIMACYIYTMLVLIGAQCVVSLTGFILKDDIIRWTEESHTRNSQAAKYFKDIVTDNVYITFYCALVASCVQLVCLFVTYCYKGTLKRVSYSSTGNRQVLLDKIYDWEDPEKGFDAKASMEKLNNLKNQVRKKVIE